MQNRLPRDKGQDRCKATPKGRVTLVDAGAFAGRWPFRRLGQPAMADLLRSNERLGIAGGLVSCLDSIFYNDPMEGDEELAKELPPGFRLALSHNPMLPHSADEVGENRLHAAAVRLYPSYHGYSLEDPAVDRLCRAAVDAGLVICVQQRLEDARLDYILRQSAVPAADIAALAGRHPGGRFVLCGVSAGELAGSAALFAGTPNLYADTAYSGNLPFPFERLCAALPADRLLFATYRPLLCPESNVLALEAAELNGEDRPALSGGNARALFGL